MGDWRGIKKIIFQDNDCDDQEEVILTFDFNILRISSFLSLDHI